MSASKKTEPEPRLRRVAILVDTSTDWGRRIIHGVLNYVREHERWQLFVEPVGLEEELVLPSGWKGDGVIARVGTPKIARHLQARKLPVVNISGMQVQGPRFPRVANDVRLAAKMAAEYFLARGFRHFTYISPRGFEYVEPQQKAFSDTVEASGATCSLYSLKTHHGAQTVDWNTDIESLGAWLKTLPKPVAVLTWSGGREVIYACQSVGLSVPDEVAVLSGSDDFLCEMCQIPISGVRAAGEQIGYTAAAQLDRLMNGEPAPTRSKYIPPVEIVSRLSTDTLAVEDTSLLKAIRYIRENAGESIQVNDAARHAGICRRGLERRFGQELNCTPAEYIRRSRLERARHYLRATDLPMPEVAEAAGFGSAAYMSYAFRKEMETSPLKFRRETRGRQAG